MLKRALLCSAAFVLAASAGFAAPKVATSKSRSWVGYVTDSKCAKSPKERTNAACVKKCLSAGAKLVLFDTYTKKVYQLDPQSAVEAHATHHVRIYGTLDKDGDTIHVTSVKMLAMPKHKAMGMAKPGV